MPIGSYAAVPSVASSLIMRQPRRILDLGIGFGMNGAMVRQWIDLGITPRKVFLIGVEVWSEYRSPLWDLYDMVHVKTIESYFASTSETFDAVLLGDVLEHFERGLGEEVLEESKKRLSDDGLLLVATPHGDMPQGACYGNPYEEHKSGWVPQDFIDRGFQVLLSGETPQLPPAAPTIVAEYRKLP